MIAFRAGGQGAHIERYDRGQSPRSDYGVSQGDRPTLRPVNTSRLFPSATDEDGQPIGKTASGLTRLTLVGCLLVLPRPTNAATPWSRDGSLRDAAEVQLETCRTSLEERVRIRRAGINTVRWGIAWANVEKQRRQYDWRESDAFVENLPIAGLRSVVILGLGNELYDRGVAADPASIPPGNQASRAAFRRYAAAAAARYRNAAITWEIWSEPDLSRFRSPQPNFQDYARLAAATCNAIREADACAIGPASASSPDPARSKNFLLISALQTSSPWRCLDAVSAHFYEITTGTLHPRVNVNDLAHEPGSGERVPPPSGRSAVAPENVTGPTDQRPAE